MKMRLPKKMPMKSTVKSTAAMEAGAAKLPAFMKKNAKKKGSVAMESSTGGY